MNLSEIRIPISHILLGQKKTYKLNDRAYPKNYASRDTLRPLCFVLRDLQAAVECEALCFALC